MTLYPERKVNSEPVWAEISCRILSSMVDPVSEFLVEVSGTGVTVENLAVDTFSPEDIEDSPVKTVKAYLLSGTGLEEKVAAIAAFLATTGASFHEYHYHYPEIGYLTGEDWANNWKEHFKPSRIGRRLVIKPSWSEFAAREADVILELDPGMAFGTGTHPTTQLCLKAMEKIFDGVAPFNAGSEKGRMEVLDVGTGSGVLAIAAAKLGAAKVVGLDIDPSAVEVATANMARNGVENIACAYTAKLEEIKGPFDIVLANILAEELVRLSPALVGKLGPGGIIILSGILNERENLVLSGFSPYHLNLVEISREQEWSCIAYRFKR